MGKLIKFYILLVLVHVYLESANIRDTFENFECTTSDQNGDGFSLEWTMDHALAIPSNLLI